MLRSNALAVTETVSDATRGRPPKACSDFGCDSPAAFRTNTRPAWCFHHLEARFVQGGLRTIDESPGNYGAWRLTECLICGVQAHYRLQYVLDQLKYNIPTCRACYWRKWADEARRMARGARSTFVSDDAARRMAEENGYQYLGALTSPSLADDPHHVRCRNCQRLSAERLADIGWGCACLRNTRSATPAGPLKSAKVLFGESGSPALKWWDHDRNAADLLGTLTAKARLEVAWRCPDCDHRFTDSVNSMTNAARCPDCSARTAAATAARRAIWRTTRVASVPELLLAWADDADPQTVMVAADMTIYRFRCPAGHHPRLTPLSFMSSGCPSCRGNATRNATDKPTLEDQLPEVAEQWHPTKNRRLTPRDVNPWSKRSAWWRDPICGHEWQSVVGHRDKYQRWRCPTCRTILDSLAYTFPALAAEWSPANPVTAWQVRPHASTTFVPAWICSTDPTHTWTALLSSRSVGAECPECQVAGKSRVELDHHEAAVARFGSARSGAVVRHKVFRRRPSWTVDILVPADGRAGLAIEYDGSYWHSGKIDIDVAKTLDLLDAGYLVARLREAPLPPLPIDRAGYLEIVVRSIVPRPEQVIDQVANWVSRSART